MAGNEKQKEEKRERKFPFLLAMGALLAFTALIVALKLFLLTPGAFPSGPGKAEADAFLEKLRKNQTDLAWQSAGSDLKSYMGKDSLRTFVKKNPAFKESASSVAVEKTDGEGREVHEYLTKKSGKKITVGVTLENGIPKVDSLQIR